MPNHYLIFTLSSELLANKVVIKIFQNYPKTLPVLNWEDADANLQEGDLLRRMRFPGTDTQAVAADVAATGLKALGGADLQSTRIWWDVEGMANF
ncbi:SusD/RagB family nutrient-binding outer membrane lipoprotein [Bacteroides salyersiae]|uniref:SusD/RagB family nutrient-binding outer membrane lipoprotein n=1 Tax=Bacteroides salyersiae TaxID=291644 RepID=UPI0021AB0C8C|nr:SusD/RagB family nutrient-binding outer membrane lipoprotein [Bacteroides salyersiae]